MPIQILVTVESLGQYGNGKSYLGVVVQVSSTTLPTSPDERALLCPWLWSNVSFALWRLPAASIKPVVVTASAAPQSTSLSTPNADFIERLNGIYDSLTQAANPIAFSWSSVPSESGTPMDSSSASPVRLYRWPAQLAQLARYPNSVSHQLNLTSFIEFPASEVSNPQDFYVAAPIFTGNKVVYSPDPSATAIYGADKRFTITYRPTATTSGLTAQVQPLPAADCKPPAIRARDAKNHALDKSDPYVALSSADDSNWQPNLVPLSAELYDLSSRLIGAFRLSFDLNSLAWQSLQSAIAGNFDDFRLEVLKALSDVSGHGIRQPPGNKGMNDGSLLEQLMTTWINSFQDPNRRLNLRKFKDDFVSKIRTDPNGYTDWFEATKQIPALKANEMFKKLPDLSTFKLLDQPHELLRRLSVIEQLHFSFTENEILSSLVTTQWAIFAKRLQTSSASPGADVDSWNLFLASTQSSLTNINLRQQFTNGNLGDSWPSIASKLVVGSGVEGRSTLRTALSETLKSNLNAQVTNPAISAPLVNCLFVVTDSTTSLSWIDTQLTVIVPDAQTSAPSRTAHNPRGVPSRSANSIATRTSNGITLMLDTLSAQDNSDETDLMRETAGFCILARESTQLSWNCLNMAVPCFLPAGKAPVQLGPPTVVPLPLHNQGGLRQAFVTYNNQPLMCESPAMEFAQDLASQDSSARLIKYVHPSIAPTPDYSYKIPGLIFGKSYDFLAARVRNSGALPFELAATDDPGKLTLGQANNQFASHGHTVVYTRTVPVSELRFGPDVSPAVEINTSLKVPAIAPDVQPKALDDPSPIPKQTDANEPLILLTSYKDVVGSKSFSFNVYKPTLDILTWDCWVGIDPKYASSAESMG